MLAHIRMCTAHTHSRTHAGMYQRTHACACAHSNAHMHTFVNVLRHNANVNLCQCAHANTHAGRHVHTRTCAEFLCGTFSLHPKRGKSKQCEPKQNTSSQAAYLATRRNALFSKEVTSLIRVATTASKIIFLEESPTVR